MMSGVGAVQLKWSKLSYEMIGGAPDLDMRVMRDSDVVAIGRELDSLHRFLKVEMVHDHASSEVDE